MRLLESGESSPKADWSALRRFLPYLWPRGEAGLKARVVAAVLLVLIAKGATLTMPFAYKAAIDRMSAGMEAQVGLAIALVAAYAGARFGGVLFDNFRNAIFERVGQDAARRLAETVFRHQQRVQVAAGNVGFGVVGVEAELGFRPDA